MTTETKKEETPQTTALVAQNKRAELVKTTLEQYRPQIAAALPRHISPDRMLRIALTEGQRPEIMKCHVGSFVGSVLLASQLGLELGSGLGQAYLVPFWNKKTKRDEVQLIPGYRELVHLVRQTGKVDKFAAHVVYARDTFDLSFGVVDTLVHRPFIAKPKMKNKNPGPVIGAYAIVGFLSGTPQFEWMSLEQLEEIRQRSKAKDAGPWMTDTLEMYRKTVARRLSKWLPMSTELATALDLDNRHDAGEAQILPEIKVTSLPSVAMIEASDPVIDTYGVGGSEDDGKAEGRFRDLLAAMDEAEDLGELEIARDKAHKAAFETEWEAEAEAKFQSLRSTRFGNVRD